VGQGKGQRGRFDGGHPQETSYPLETLWPVIAHLLTGAISSVEA